MTLLNTYYMSIALPRAGCYRGILLFSAKSMGNAVRIFMPFLPLSLLFHQVLGHYRRGNCPKKEARLKIMMFFYTHLLLDIRK